MTEELPKNWISASLEELVLFAIGGDWGKAPDFDDPNFVDVCCIRASEIREWNTKKGSTAALRRIKESSLKSRKLICGDILVEISGGGPEQPVGRTVLIDKQALNCNPKVPKICTNFFRLIRPSKEINSSYLNCFLQFFYKTGKVSAYQAGSNNLRNLKFNDYLTLSIPIPPLNEQRRIVAKIEELFSELDKGIESLKTAREQLKIYRQAVLKHAFEGKLTARWREENKDKLESADQLLTRIKKERETRYQQKLEEWNDAVKVWEADGKPGKKPKKPRQSKQIDIDDDCYLSELPVDWGQEYLGHLNSEVFDGPFGSNLKTSDYVGAGVRVIRLENIGYLQFIDDKYSYVTEEKYYQINKHTVRPNDIIFSSFVSDGIRVAIIPETIKRAVNKADCFCIRLHGETIRNDYLATFLSTNVAYKQIEQDIHGIGRPRINTTQLKNFLIPVPSREEQNQIMLYINDQLSLADYIEAAINQELKRIESLRQSILKKAFSGQLVEQDPNDEPASVLLERIKAEKATQEKNNKNKKTRKRKSAA